MRQFSAYAIHAIHAIHAAHAAHAVDAICSLANHAFSVTGHVEKHEQNSQHRRCDGDKHALRDADQLRKR